MLSFYKWYCTKWQITYKSPANTLSALCPRHVFTQCVNVMCSSVHPSAHLPIPTSVRRSVMPCKFTLKGHHICITLPAHPQVTDVVVDTVLLLYFYWQRMCGEREGGAMVVVESVGPVHRHNHQIFQGTSLFKQSLKERTKIKLQREISLFAI